MNQSPDQLLQLPEELRQRFQLLNRRLWRVDTIIALCGAVLGLLLSYALLFVSDRFWDTPAALRLMLTSCGVLVAFYFLWGWLRQWVFQKRDTRALANVVQRHHRRLGDRLLGIVELADEDKRASDVSPALCRAAIAQVSAEAVKFDFRQAVATRKPKLFLLAAIALFLLVLTPWMLVPSAGWNALTRWLSPVGHTPRFTFVSLEELPASLVVPHGEAFEIACRVDTHSFWNPSWATAQYGGQSPVRAQVVKREVVFRMPGQTDRGVLTLRVGDVARRIAIEPTFRPALKQLVARLQLPSYLQYPAATDVPVPNATLAYVEGSKATFIGTTTRPLAQASMALTSEETNHLGPQPLAVREAQFQTSPLLLDGLAGCEFAWRDILGLGTAAPWALSLQSRFDQSPQADCPNQPGVVAMLVDEVLEINTTGEDDFGLRSLGVSWQCQKRQETNVVAQDHTVIKEGSPQSTNLVGTFRFAPSLLRLPEETIVTLHATTVDYKPGRAPAHSNPYRIYILGHEEHAELIQQQFEKLLAEVEELTRRQEGLLEAGRETKEQSPSELSNEKTKEKLQEQASEQAAIAEKTERLAREGTETVREALRNKTIPTDLLQEWTKHMDTMQQLSQKQMPQAAQSLNAAQQKPRQREQELAEALEKEKEILEQLQDLQKKLGPALDRLLANSLAQRLRKIGQFQTEIQKSLQRILPETIGLKAEELPSQFAMTTTRLSVGQQKSGVETQALEDEISRFFHRTSLTNYGTVSREMHETKVVENLSNNGEMIRQNIAAQAMQQAVTLADQFTRWAESLDAAKKSKPKDGGAGEGSANEAALQRLLALLRVRQGEVNLRQHTQVLDQLKAGRSSYPEDSIILSVRQSLLSDDVKGLQEEDPGKFLAQTDKAMIDAQSLLAKPNTGLPTVAAETDAVNLLEAEIMGMMQNQESQGQQAAMAMLMQMMGMGQGKGNQAGANMSGGTTDKTGDPAAGNPAGRAAGAREVEKTSGRDTRPVPVEYRDALQNYYKAIERINQ